MKECADCLKKELSSILDFAVDFFLTTCSGIGKYSKLFLVLIAFFTCAVTYDEFIFKRIPFAVVEQLTFEEISDKKICIVKPVLGNHGNYPIVVKLKSMTLKRNGKNKSIKSDEASQFILSPGNKFLKEEVSNPINVSNGLGSAFIKLKLLSKPINGRRFKYVTEGEYKIFLKNDKLQYEIINEKMYERKV